MSLTAARSDGVTEATGMLSPSTVVDVHEATSRSRGPGLAIVAVAW